MAYSRPVFAVFYEITFVDYGGHGYRLDTIDPAKIGPWLAEMYMLYPYIASSPTSVRINTSRIQLPNA